MELLTFRHLWGVNTPWEHSFLQFKQAGYDGIETRLPDTEQAERFRDLISAHDYAYIPQIFTAGSTVREHIESFRAQVEFASIFNPQLVNCHAGSDMFSLAEAEAFFKDAVRIADEVGVAVAHETHRGRVLYHPTIAEQVLDAVPDLKLCADFSHWVCVCERLIDAQLPIIERCAKHTIHLHARVGFEEGPQVPDPRAPEYQGHVEAHERWWDIVWKTQAEAGTSQSTITPEFGPPRYLHTLPFTGAPLADLEEICNWQADRQRERFSKQFYKNQ